MKHLQQLRFIDAVARAGSIRRAAETLAITSTALNRRILSVEEDLGTPIFDRVPNGVRLSVAGELFIQHARQQISGMQRVKSQIADLSGERRGHVSILCGQAYMPQFLPRLVSNYRAQHPNVSFSAIVGGWQEASDALDEFTVDLALVYDMEVVKNVQVLHEVPQPLYAVMADEHPLALQTELRLSDCVEYPMALPSMRSGIRHSINAAAARRSLTFEPAIESDNVEFLMQYVQAEQMLTFQVPLAFSDGGLAKGICAVPLSIKDVPLGNLRLAQQKGRHLPVAAAKFALDIAEGLSLLG